MDAFLNLTPPATLPSGGARLKNATVSDLTPQGVKRAAVSDLTPT